MSLGWHVRDTFPLLATDIKHKVSGFYNPLESTLVRHEVLMQKVQLNFCKHCEQVREAWGIERDQQSNKFSKTIKPTVMKILVRKSDNVIESVYSQKAGGMVPVRYESYEEAEEAKKDFETPQDWEVINEEDYH